MNFNLGGGERERASETRGCHHVYGERGAGCDGGHFGRRVGSRRARVPAAIVAFPTAGEHLGKNFG